jgi:enolase
MYESVVLRDGDQNEYDGLSVHKAVANVNKKVAPLLVGMDVFDQKALDQAMIMLDGTPNKANLGGNAVYSTSIACMRAAAAASGKELYEYSPPRRSQACRYELQHCQRRQTGRSDSAFQRVHHHAYKAGSIEKALKWAFAYTRSFMTLSPNTLQPPRIALSYGYAAPSDDPRRYWS